MKIKNKKKNKSSDPSKYNGAFTFMAIAEEQLVYVHFGCTKHY
jgi:hypothetical protein